MPLLMLAVFLLMQDPNEHRLPFNCKPKGGWVLFVPHFYEDQPAHAIVRQVNSHMRRMCPSA
jgi:hypothetical protein